MLDRLQGNMYIVTSYYNIIGYNRNVNVKSTGEKR